MHQLVSSVVVFFLSPVHWILIFAIAGLLFRKKRYSKPFYIIAIVIFLLFSNQLLLGWYAKKWQPLRSVIDPSKQYSCGIVLGGFASMDAEKFAYFNGSADRFIQTLKLYKLGIIQHILISGGNGSAKNNFREAAWIKDEFIAMGVPDSVIFVEDRSGNTADNAIHAKRILDSLHLAAPYLLVTSSYHIPRASLLFQKAGVQTQPFACNYIAPNHSFGFLSFLPQLSILETWEAYLKEAAGYWWYK